jgi:hypothetical protein
VETDPSKANVVIDGKKFGMSPVTVFLSLGSDHRIEIAFNGYDKRDDKKYRPPDKGERHKVTPKKN